MTAFNAESKAQLVTGMQASLTLAEALEVVDTTALEQQVADLTAQVAMLTTQRDTAFAERDTARTERDAAVQAVAVASAATAELQARLDGLGAKLDALDSADATEDAKRAELRNAITGA